MTLGRENPSQTASKSNHALGLLVQSTLRRIYSVSITSPRPGAHAKTSNRLLPSPSSADTDADGAQRLGVSEERQDKSHALAPCEEGRHADSHRLCGRRVESDVRL